MSKATTRGIALRRTALAVALFGVFGYVPSSGAVDLVVGNEHDLGQSNMTSSTITVIDGGVLTGDGASVSGSAYDVLRVDSGGSATLVNTSLSNDLDHPTGTNGRTARATGANANLTLIDSDIGISAHSTNAGADYNHAFTAGVGADGGGHVDIQGGSITAEGSKRTVGMQANDGGSISARDLEITTHNHFGHAVQVYRNPAGAEIDTYVSLDRVSIRTLGENYSLGVQVANKGASLAATDTSIVTEGAASSGVEVFNGATAELVNGSITTKGDVAAGVRVYGGALGSGLVSVDGTRIVTEGQYSSGILAGDAAEPTSGVVGVRNADIATAGNHASGIEAAHGSLVLSTDSSLRTGGDQAHGVYIHDGGSAALNGDSITTDGLHSYGMFASGSGSTISAVDTNVTTNGIRGYGAHADGGGVIDLEGGSVTTANPKGQGSQDGDGSRAYALYAKGAGSEIRSQGGTQVTTLGQRAYGAYAEHGGRIELNDATIATHGFMAYGIYANWEGSTIDANNVDITTTGEVGDGVWAWSGVVNLNGGSVTVGGEPNPNWPHETANGLVAVGGTDLEAGGVINATGARIRTMGTDSAGVVAGARNGTVPVKGTVNLTDSSVDVLGEGSVAARVSYGGTLNATGSMLRSAQGNGIVMTDDATVHLVGTNIEAARASLVSNLNSAGRTQNIVIGSGSTLTMNNGTLLQVNRSSEGMDGVVNLTLGAGSSARGDIVDLDGLSPGSPAREGRTNFIVDSGASWVGMVQGINDVSMEDGTSFVDEGGAPIAGNVRVGENATLIFNNGATIGGGLSTATGTQGIFNGAATLGGSIVGTGSILRFNDSANIGGGISTASTTVAFSTSAPTIIGGDVDLDQGSVLNGGSSATPIVIHGNANVHNGSILGGNLFVEGALGGSGGTLSPGNSIGTQSYATSAGFSGAYVAEVNGKGLSDLIVIRDGNFDLSGIGLTVAQENGDGGYLLNHAYTIVRTEAGDIVNEFASETLDPVSFANARVRLDPVQYGQKNVQISLSVDEAGIDSTSWSPNQQAAYRGVISAGSGNPLAFAVLASPDMDNALNQISGELHGSTQAALLNASHLMVRTLSNRMRDSLSAGAIPVPANPDASATTSGYPLWAEVVGNWSTLDSDGNAAKADTRTGGLFLGGDAEAGQGWRVGGALGFTDGKVKVDGRSSKSDVTSYTAALYAGNSWPTGRGNLNWLGGFAYTHHDIDTRRSVSVGGPQTLKAGYKANTTQLFAELAHTFPLGQASTLEPYLGLAWASQRAKSFAETGGVAALRGKSAHDDVVNTTVGVRGATALDMGDRQATLKGGLGWRHAAGDIDPRRHMAFRQGGGAEFAVAGAPIAKNAAVVDLSAEFSIGKKSSAGLSYAGQFGDGNTDNSASLYWKTRF